VSTFTVAATVAHPARPDRRLTLDLFVDTGSTWTLLPTEVVTRLGLETPGQRTVELASGERVTYPMGQVAMQVDGEQIVTIFLAGPPGCQPLLGAVTLEEFSLSVDPVRKRLVSVPGFLLWSQPPKRREKKFLTPWPKSTAPSRTFSQALRAGGSAAFPASLTFSRSRPSSR